jgi:hypothetical protein
MVAVDTPACSASRDGASRCPVAAKEQHQELHPRDGDAVGGELGLDGAAQPIGDHQQPQARQHADPLHRLALSVDEALDELGGRELPHEEIVAACHAQPPPSRSGG